MIVYNNSLEWLSIFTCMATSLLHSKFLSLLIRLSVYQTQASSLGILITFVNTSHFNLVELFVCFTFAPSVINSIYLKQLVIL
jgi:hypothetical protein